MANAQERSLAERKGATVERGSMRFNPRELSVALALDSWIPDGHVRPSSDDGGMANVPVPSPSSMLAHEMRGPDALGCAAANIPEPAPESCRLILQASRFVS
jgi:hypothetical protein